MGVLESYVVKKTKTHAEKMGWLHRKVVYQNRSGAPDDWFFGHNGRLIIIEFKKPGERPEPHQWREIRRLRRRGFDVRVIDNVEDGIAVFTEWGGTELA
jgi:hypothetical protein